MKYIAAFCLTCIFHYAGYSINDQQKHRLLSEADSLFAAGAYQRAGIVYDQLAYLAGSNHDKTLALLKKADCYLMRENYEGAEKCLDRVVFYDLSDSVQFDARYKGALASYLNSNFSGAESHIIQAMAFIADTQMVINAFPLYALVLNESGRWNEARDILWRYIQAQPWSTAKKQQQIAEVEKMYAANKIPRLKDVEKAKKMSSLLPGTGQLYCGFWGEGLVNVSLQVAGLAFTGIGVWKGYYASGVLIGFSIFQKFYIGGINRTEFLANKRNYLLKRKFNNSAKVLILDIRT